MKKIITWDPKKNALLKQNNSRGNVCFEDCVNLIEEGNILDDIVNTQRPHQRIFILNIGGYAYAVPYVMNEKEIFLKTIYPSRLHTKIYLK